LSQFNFFLLIMNDLYNLVLILILNRFSEKIVI
jgi:hypothetical protein